MQSAKHVLNFVIIVQRIFFLQLSPIIERKYLSGENGCFTLPTENTYLCVSVGLPYEGYCYKFLASIIESE